MKSISEIKYIFDFQTCFMEYLTSKIQYVKIKSVEITINVDKNLKLSSNIYSVFVIIYHIALVLNSSNRQAKTLSVG